MASLSRGRGVCGCNISKESILVNGVQDIEFADGTSFGEMMVFKMERRD